MTKQFAPVFGPRIAKGQSETIMDVELTPSVTEVTPSEEPAVEVPVETPAVETPTETLYKMPDGRELTGAQVKEEYEKLLPDYTQKSQKLAELTREKDPNINNTPEWKREGYVPKSYAEIIEIAETQALERIVKAGEAEEAKRAEVTAQVDAQVKALKAKDPKLDENILFAHANKYGFRDLNMAYENLAEMKKVAVVTEERILKGKKIDPIATRTGSGGGAVPRYQPASSATEFLSRLKK